MGCGEGRAGCNPVQIVGPALTHREAGRAAGQWSPPPGQGVVGASGQLGSSRDGWCRLGGGCGDPRLEGVSPRAHSPTWGEGAFACVNTVGLTLVHGALNCEVGPGRGQARCGAGRSGLGLQGADWPAAAHQGPRCQPVPSRLHSYRWGLGSDRPSRASGPRGLWGWGGQSSPFPCVPQTRKLRHREGTLPRSLRRPGPRA